jgi:hypothetical protein
LLERLGTPEGGRHGDDAIASRDVSDSKESLTYVGSCHCGAVRYEVTMAPPEKAVACNCSHCSRAGWLLTFVPADRFRLLSGEDHLQEYLFHKRHIHHQFCRTCGMHPFSRGSDRSGNPTVSINLRCISEIDPTKLQVQTFDGKSL